jgi:hypothetical protein
MQQARNQAVPVLGGIRTAWRPVPPASLGERI